MWNWIFILNYAKIVWNKCLIKCLTRKWVIKNKNLLNFVLFRVSLMHSEFYSINWFGNEIFGDAGGCGVENTKRRCHLSLFSIIFFWWVTFMFKNSLRTNPKDNLRSFFRTILFISSTYFYQKSEIQNKNLYFFFSFFVLKISGSSTQYRVEDVR